MKQLFLYLALITFYINSYAQAPYEPSAVLGKGLETEEVSAYKNYWMLDKRYTNPEKGIKVYINRDLATVSGILFSSKGYENNEVKYEEFKGMLPLNLNFADNEETILARCGKPWKKSETAFKYKQDRVIIQITFKSDKRKKIDFVKLILDNEFIEPSTISQSNAGSQNQSESSANTITETQKVVPKSENISVKVEEPKKEVIDPMKNASPFKKAMFDVINSALNNDFSEIKSSKMTAKNFWNYKFVNTTKVRVPGEKYNMLYRFPFETSQIDWVAVLDEQETYNGTIAKTHASFEKQLLSDFPSSEGWKVGYEKTDKNDELKDVKVTNSKYGSIVLDYSKSPAGKTVLYLRLILFYN